MVTSEVVGDGLQVGVSDTLEYNSPKEYWQFFVRRLKSYVAIASLSNDDGDVNENVKKAIGFSSLAKQQLCTCYHAFWYISCQSLHDNDVKMPNFTFFGGREHKTTTFFFFLSDVS